MYAHPRNFTNTKFTLQKIKKQRFCSKVKYRPTSQPQKKSLYTLITKTIKLYGGEVTWVTSTIMYLSNIYFSVFQNEHLVEFERQSSEPEQDVAVPILTLADDLLPADNVIVWVSLYKLLRMRVFSWNSFITCILRLLKIMSFSPYNLAKWLVFNYHMRTEFLHNSCTIITKLQDYMLTLKYYISVPSLLSVEFWKFPGMAEFNAMTRYQSEGIKYKFN